MTTESFQTPGESGNAERLEVLSGYATGLLFRWLTRPGQEEQAREFVREGPPWSPGAASGSRPRRAARPPRTRSPCAA
jgi:hypothetical protein